MEGKRVFNSILKVIVQGEDSMKDPAARSKNMCSGFADMKRTSWRRVSYQSDESTYCSRSYEQGQRLVFFDVMLLEGKEQHIAKTIPDFGTS